MERRPKNEIPEWLHIEKSAANSAVSTPRPLWMENKRIEEAMDPVQTHPDINVLLRRLWQKDPHTYDHSHRVADLAQWLGRFVGLSNQERVEVYLAGLLHDMGKVCTPDHILKKPGPLTPDEFEIIKKHPVDSESIVSAIEDVAYLCDPIRSHHERFDGRGYPDHHGGEDIHLFARVIFVADTFDAMTTSRVYRRGIDLEATYQEIIDCAGSQFDPEIANEFVAAHKQLREWLTRGDGKAA